MLIFYQITVFWVIIVIFVKIIVYTCVNILLIIKKPHPVWGETKDVVARFLEDTFQFTHPAWGVRHFA